MHYSLFSVLVFDFDATHDHKAAHEEPLIRAISHTPGLVLVSSQNGGYASRHAPVFRNLDLDSAPHGEDVDHCLVLDRRLTQIDLASTEDRGGIASTKVFGRIAAIEAGQYGHRAYRRVSVGRGTLRASAIHAAPDH